MADYLHIYTNNPTAGGTDGTEVSNGTGTSPIAITVDIEEGAGKAAKCALRCDAGFAVDGYVRLYFTGETKRKWCIAMDENYSSSMEAEFEASWDSELGLSDIGSTNTIFWVMALPDIPPAEPHKDTSVVLHADCTVVSAVSGQ